jgi:hypothetical protein
MTTAALVTLLMAAIEAFSMMMTALMVFTVMMVTAFMSFAMVMTAFVTFSVMMTAFVTFSMMVVVVAPGIRIIFKGSFSKSFCGCIRRSLNACVKLDSSIRKRHLRTHANSSANQDVGLCSLQETCKSTMAASVSINDLFIDDLTLFNIVQLKLLCMTEVLEDLSIFISDCDSHSIAPFLHYALIDHNRFIRTAATGDQQPLSVNERIDDLFARALVYGRYSGSGYTHLRRAGFLGESFIVQQPHGLKLVHCYLNAFGIWNIVRGKAAINRLLFYSATSDRSWHDILLSDICHL